MAAGDPEDEDTPTELPEEFKRLLNAVYSEDIATGDIDTPTALLMADKFTEAVHKGLKEVGYDYDTPNDKLLDHLRNSAFQFSAAKSWQINKLLTGLLYDGNSRRSFSEFQRAAFKELNLYVGNYGRVEYNSAVSSSQMAAKWMGFKENVHTNPYLQFKTSKAESVCPICAPYDDLIRPVNDPVWEHASPLLHFQCNCNLLELPMSHADITPDSDLPDPEMVPKMFRTNYAAKMQAFPPDHPYYTGVPKRTLRAWTKENLPA